MKIKFFCAKYEKATKAWYQQAISLAEGFRDLIEEGEDYEFFGNINYWYDNEKGEYLIKEDNTKDYDVAIYSFQFFEAGNDINKVYDPNKFNVLYDHADGHGFWTRCRQIPFDLILRTHYNKIYENQYTKNVIPWSFYLPKCVLSEIDKYEHDIEENVYVNFRLAHGLRTNQFNKMKSEIDEQYIYHHLSESLDTKENGDNNSYWSQTGRRFDPRYFEELSKHRFTFAFGGEINQQGLYQYDSWRFWEVMYSNSIPIHLDLVGNKCVFPVNPIENEHYIGIERNYDYTKLLKYSKKDLEEISTNGKLFVKENYNGKGMVKLFLNYL